MVAPAAQSLQERWPMRVRERRDVLGGWLGKAWAHPQQAAPGERPCLQLVSKPERALPPEGHQAAAAQNQHCD